MSTSTKNTVYDWSFLFDLAEHKPTENSSEEVRKAFSGNVLAKKNTVIYGAHTYHTKVPPEGIIPYLKHYTQPGDVVLDPFCGSGMTGVAAQLLASKTTDESRTVLLNDLGPAACHITYNHTNPIAPELLVEGYRQLRAKIQTEVDSLYKCWHAVTGESAVQSASLSEIEKEFDLDSSEDHVLKGRLGGKQVVLVRATVSSTIWSESYVCPLPVKNKPCGQEFSLWEVAMNPKTGVMKKTFSCPKCGGTHDRANLRGEATSRPVLIEYDYNSPVDGKRKKGKREVYRFEEEWLNRLSAKKIPYWYPTDPISPKREMMTMGPARLGIKSVDGFYFKRNLRVCSYVWSEVAKVKDSRLRRALAFACTNTFWHATRMRRFNARGGARPLTGTLYVPQISVECNVLKVLDKKIKMLEQYYSLLAKSAGNEMRISNSSATKLRLANESVDYIFTDPPFGGNIYYSDCSIIWEAWLGQFTKEESEIHFNRIRKPEDGGKTRETYKSLIEQAFSEMFRVLKPGKWASVMFNNSDDDVLETFRNAAISAGFIMDEVQAFDKGQKSFKGYMGRDGKQNVPNCDVVLNLKKPAELRTSKLISSPRQSTLNEKWIVSQIRKYLEAVSTKERKEGLTLFSSTEHRSTPFIHAHIMSGVFSKGKSFRGFTYEYLKSLCSQHFVNAGERWYLPEESVRDYEKAAGF